MFISGHENSIEFMNGQKTMTVTFCAKRWINKVMKLYEKRPEDIEIIAENPDGSICARLPVSYLKLSAPREMTDEQRQAARERLLSSKTKMNIL
jgi:hypothetical protein